MKKLKIRMDMLSLMFESGGYDIENYLDTETGELLTTDEDYGDPEEGRKAKKRIKKNPERYLLIPHMSSRDGYQDMVKFTEGLEDESLKELLLEALDGRGAFRRFRDVLERYSDILDEWYKYKDEAVQNRITEWLNENGIEAEE